MEGKWIILSSYLITIGIMIKNFNSLARKDVLDWNAIFKGDFKVPGEHSIYINGENYFWELQIIRRISMGLGAQQWLLLHSITEGSVVGRLPSEHKDTEGLSPSPTGGGEAAQCYVVHWVQSS
jgi:hypothetical protein